MRIKSFFLVGAILLACAAPLHCFAESNVVKQKVIDNGGQGIFKAIAVKESTLPNFTVYRPSDMYWASVRENKMPVLIWANGGCMDTSIGYERMLTEIASQGYVIIAIGELQINQDDRKEEHTPSEMIGKAIDWVLKQAVDKESEYYGCIDPTKIAAAGHSCGGAQVIANAGDQRIATYVMFNAGMGDMEMAGANKDSLYNLHAPLLYITGGEKDVAYSNAQLDYDRIAHVPVAYADLSTSGHGGTFGEIAGGDYGRMVLAWLDWQLKGRKHFSPVFEASALREFPGWTMKQKNFPNQISELWIKNGNRKIFGIVSEPTNVEKKKVAIISHGFNGSHHFGRDYFEVLNKLGYLVYSFDFPCGSTRSASDNNTLNMSILDEKEDVKNIVHYFQQRDDIDTDNIVLIGESQGGLVSALAAADLQDEISKLVLIYPALCIPDNWNEKYPTVESIPEITDFWNVKLSRRFFLELRDIDVYPTITKYTGPVMIVQGSKDAVVAVEYAERAMKEYQNAHLGIIPGAGHGFKPEQRKVSNLFVQEFLEK